MAMTILYNSGAQSALNTFNQNNLQANNSLLKLASGEKFIGAQGESASYAISEKMREQIRSLYQDEQNVQNGSSLVRTAERGIDQIIENLRTMKELAIDAANDSNTDEDRHTIQKEIAQRRKVINDIAIGTQYNGKILLDGRYTKQTIFIEANVGTIDEQNAYVNGVTGMFSSVKATMRKTGAMSWADGKMAYKNPANVFVPLDFSGATINGKALKLPSQMNQQGFSVMCTFGGCQSFFGFILQGFLGFKVNVWFFTFAYMMYLNIAFFYKGISVQAKGIPVKDSFVVKNVLFVYPMFSMVVVVGIIAGLFGKMLGRPASLNDNCMPLSRIKTLV